MQRSSDIGRNYCNYHSSPSIVSMFELLERNIRPKHIHCSIGLKMIYRWNNPLGTHDMLCRSKNIWCDSCYYHFSLYYHKIEH